MKNIIISNPKKLEETINDFKLCLGILSMNFPAYLVFDVTDRDSYIF